VNGIAAMIVAAVVMTGLMPSAVAQSNFLDRILVVVNDDIILQSEVEQALKPVAASLDQQNIPPSQKRQILAEQRKLALNRMIEDKLKDQQVRRYNIEISDQEVEKTIERILMVNRISREELLRQLEMSGTSYADYKLNIRDQIMRARLVSREVSSKIVITDSDVKAYYDANKERYIGTAKYGLRHILMRVAPSDGADRKTQVRRQMEAVVERLNKGEAFDTLAGLYSNAATAAKGGELGIFSEESLTDQVRNALAGLQEGQFTAILDTPQGYQVFYIDKIDRSGNKSLEEATPEIHDKLYADIVDKEFKKWLENLRNKSHIQIVE
jgi:peptidyl-prolyl cis-trans isomerase SurA